MGIFPSPSFAQLIDTALDPAVTLKDTVNRDIGRLKGMDVKIYNPELVYHKGKKIESGFKNYYIYIVKARDVRINEAPLFTSDTAVFLAVAAFESKLKEIPKVIESRAIYLKGMIDKADSLKKLYGVQMKESKAWSDSLMNVARKTMRHGMEEKFERKLDSAYTRYYSDVYYFNLYQDFLYYRKYKPSKMADFFISDYFNRRDLKYSILAGPYCLPKISDGLPDLGNKKNKQTRQKKNKAVQENEPDMPLQPTREEHDVQHEEEKVDEMELRNQ